MLACGRRWGKSLLAAEECIDAAVNQGKNGWFISLTNSNLHDHWLAVKRLVGNRYTDKSEQRKYLEFQNGDMRGSVAFKSADRPDNLLGSGLDFAVIDEAAYQNPDLWYRVIRPSLSDKLGWALIISTPNGVANWFHKLYMKGLDPEETEWSSYKFPSSTNPYLPTGEVLQAKKDLPDLKFRQEYLAEFVSDAGGVFRSLEVSAVVPLQTFPDEGHGYCMGIDWGRKADYTAISVIDTDTLQQVYLERFTDIGYQVQRDRIVRLYENWKPKVIYAEANAMGSPNIEALQQDGLPVRGVFMTNLTKTRLVEQLAAYLEHGHLSILAPSSAVGEIQLGELMAYEIKRTAGGKVTYSAVKGFHDDTVIALILSAQGIRKPFSNNFSSVKNPFYKGTYINELSVDFI